MSDILSDVSRAYLLNTDVDLYAMLDGFGPQPVPGTPDATAAYDFRPDAAPPVELADLPPQCFEHYLTPGSLASRDRGWGNYLPLGWRLTQAGRDLARQLRLAAQAAADAEAQAPDEG